MIWFDSINGVTRAAGPTPRRPAKGSTEAGGFNVPDSQAQATDEAAPMVETSLDGMLALQEAQSTAVGDREARRQGQDILAELARLQRALLSGEDDSASLERLAALVENAPPAEDPRLQAVLDAVRLRARIEMARREAGLSR